MTEPIHRQLRTIRRNQRLHQRHIATNIGVHVGTVTNWDSGRKAPFVHHADAYTRTLHHRLVATLHSAVIDNLADILPALPELRRVRGITQEVLGLRAGVSECAVRSAEARIHAGDSLLLTTAEWYVAGLDYQVGIIPARAMKRAA